MSISRRRFVGRVSEAALAASLLPGCLRERPREPSSAAPAPLPAVDTHQHLWDLSRFDLPWVRSTPTLARSFLVVDYVAASAGLGIEQAMYMEVAVRPDQIVAEAEHAVELCGSSEGPTRAAVIGGRPAEPGFEGYVRRFREHECVKGVRQVLFSSPGLCLTDPFVESMRLLGRLGLTFDVCLPPGQLRDAATLAGRCPETRFVLDHCGNADPKAFAPPEPGETPSHDPDAWRRDMAEVARRDNVVCKVSGIVARARPERWGPEDLAPIVAHCREVFGPDRLIFGSDWPVCTPVASLRQWTEALRRSIRDWPLDEQRRLLRDNAVRLFGL